MQQYSPFDKPINDLQPTDLAKLKSVNEGWYVDYKRDLINAGAMAKAVSSFTMSSSVGASRPGSSMSSMALST